MLLAGAGRSRAAPPTPPFTDAEVAVLRSAFGRAPRHGLNAAAFEPALNAGGEAAARAAVAWARALSTGLVDPADLHAIFTLTRNALDATSGLQVARAGGRLDAWLRALPPADPGYRALSDAYLARLGAPATQDVPPGPPIRAGEADPRLAEIARRLGVGSRDSGATPTLDAEMLAALRAFQAAEGVAADGVVGPDTLAALNLGPQDRARQLAVNLERRRWLTRRPPSTRIDVNIAAARLTYIRDDAPVLVRRVVAGALGHETPMLEAAFTNLVVNPPWHVPASIAAREILPKGAAYLAAHDMTVRGGRVVQAPGPGSALGLVKFDMRNPHAIYLHDTPAKALFAAPDRWRSHGCVRVEGAVAFAQRLAQERGRGDEFEAALASGQTRVVELGDAIPVRLLYHTADLDPVGGGLTFSRDAYGWDAALADRMAFGPGRVRALVRLPPDPLAP